MARSLFDAEPNVAFLVLSKALSAKRQGKTLADRNCYKSELSVGDHHISGTVNFDIDFTVGEDTEAARYYGVPVDSTLLVAFYYSAAVREHFVRAAHVMREIRTAELECEETGKKRPYNDVAYTFKRVLEDEDGNFSVNEEKHVVSASEVEKYAALLTQKLVGVNPEETERQQQKRALLQECIADCLGKLKRMRPYDGPVNLGDVHLDVDLATSDLAVKAA